MDKPQTDIKQTAAQESAPELPRYKNGKLILNGNSKYKESYNELLLEHFSVAEKREVEHKTIDKDGIERTYKKEYANQLPTFEGFCCRVGISPKVIYDWIEKYPEFSKAYNICKLRQKEILINNSLDGSYNANFAIFAAKNMTDMKDKTEVEHQGALSVNHFFTKLLTKCQETNDFEAIQAEGQLLLPKLQAQE